MRRVSHRLVPWALLVAGELVSAGFLLLPDARSRLGTYLVLVLAGSLLSLLAARSLSASSIAFLLLCGGLFRATLIPRAPDLSDDLYRFVWDGRVAAAGISPYRFAPDTPELADKSLHDRQATRVLLIPKPFTGSQIARALEELLKTP